MRGLLAPLTLIGVCAVALGIALWSPWDGRERERELAWTKAYAAWWTSIERATRAGRTIGRAACSVRFDDEVGAAPTSRLADAADTAREPCGRASDVDAWRYARWEVLSALIDGHSSEATTTREPGLSRIARSIAGEPVWAYCWVVADWVPLSEQFGNVRGDELGAIGIADPVERRIDLAPEICEPLRRFERREFPAPLTLENLDLAEALATLAHEAEHLRVPEATEAEVECYSLQRVRSLVGAAGRGPAYQDELAGLYAENAYPYMPDEYRTELCRDGGPLDLHPASDVWP